MVESNSRSWVGDFYTEIEEQLKANLSGRLRRDLDSRFGSDVIQEVFVRFLESLESPKLAGINSSNWRSPSWRRILERWVIAATRLLTLEKIRESRKFDHGGIDFDVLSCSIEADLSEVDEELTILLSQCPILRASSIRRTLFDGATDEQLATELGISEVGVRGIRYRVRKWLQQVSR